MDTIKKSQKKISTYRTLIGVREGLSFSDYMDDSVPADVKPSYSLTPMEEESYQEKENVNLVGQGWLDKDGKYASVSSHHFWAASYLSSKGIKYDSDHTYDKMYELGFVRIDGSPARDCLYFDHAIGVPPTPIQMRIMKNYCIEHQWRLHDDSEDEDIDLIENVKESDFPTQAKDLFKGLHEEKLEWHSWHWMDRQGEFYTVTKEEGAAYAWAQKLLAANGIKSDDDDALDKMYDLGFILVFVGGGIINYEYNLNNKPNEQQIQSLLKASVSSKYDLYDKTKHALIRNDDINKTFLEEGKHNRRIFILEHMKPDNMDTFKSHLAQLFAHLQKELQLKTVPKLKLLSDEKNADKILCKTAYYNPDKKEVVLYITNRHQKDILRSFAHEVIHHWQHENEQLQTSSTKGKTGEDPQYAQNNPWLRQMEKQAYLLGNILFRDWEDEKKSKDRKSSKKMVEKTMLIGKQYPPKRQNYKG